MRRSIRTVIYFICGWLPFVSSALAGEVVFSVPRSDEGSQVAIEARVPAGERAVIQVASNHVVANSSSNMPSARISTASDRPASPSSERSLHDHDAYAAQAWLQNGCDRQRLLRYMQCDHLSCPNIWNGYQSQREAELARKCAPWGCGHGLGCGCSQAGPTACRGGCSPSSGGLPLNRYRLSSACDEIPSAVSLSSAPPRLADPATASLSASPAAPLATPDR